METFWDKFISRYGYIVCDIDLRLILKAFWYFIEKGVKRCDDFLMESGFDIPDDNYGKMDDVKTVHVITTELCEKCDILRILSAEDRRHEPEDAK